MKHTLESFIQETEDNNLRLIQINTQSNDYPTGLGSYGAIGFNAYKEAEDFCEKNGGEICSFKTRQGHTFWRKEGNVYSPFSYEDYLDKCNDNVNYTTLSEETESFWSAVSNAKDDFEHLKVIVEKHQKTIDFFENLKDNEVGIYNGNSDTLESCKQEFMQFSEDVYTYSIGVYFNPKFHTK